MKRFFYTGFTVITLVLMTSCSLFERSMQRSSRKDNPENADSSTVVDPEFAAKKEMKEHIRILEKRLTTQKQKEQYSKILPWLKDDQEKIDYLNLPDLESKRQWAQQKGVYQRSQSPTPEVKELIDNQDIAIGMPMDFVVKSWGEPNAKEISGNPIFKNERWRYVRNISSAEGYRQEKRSVYFENGRVVGWETE